MPKLHYFEVYGKAEFIRIALWYLGVQYENVYHAGEDWLAFKPTTEFGQLPVLELDDGTQLAQSMSIFNYVCDIYGKNKEGFCPTDPLANYNGECTTAVLADDFVNKHVIPAWYMPDGEEKTKKWQTILTVEWPKTVGFLQKRVPSEGFLCGGTFTKWDILFSVFFLNVIRNKNFKNQEVVTAMWAATPENVQGYVNRVEEHLKEYLETRP